MTYFILEIIFFLSLGVMIFMAISKLPTIDFSFVDDQDAQESKRKKNLFLSKLISSIDQKAIDLWEKFLRKTKLFVIKLDSLVSKKIESAKRIQSMVKKEEDHIFRKLDQEKLETEEEKISDKDENGDKI